MSPPSGAGRSGDRLLVFAAVDARGRSYIAQFDLETWRTTELTSLGDSRFDGENLSVSADGRWILYARAETSGDVMLVENFR